MKNIEKMAVDSLASDFAKRNEERVQVLENYKKELDEAKANFMSVAKAMISDAKELASEIESELSPEGLEYLEKTFSAIIKVPFELKK